jgi:hypothetical protein
VECANGNKQDLVNKDIKHKEKYISISVKNKTNLDKPIIYLLNKLTNKKHEYVDFNV